MSRERGSASVLALVMAAALVTVALAAGSLGGLLAGQRRAAAAADLAALAAAEAVAGGAAGSGGGACQQAGAIATANRARLTACAVDGPDVTISVAVDVSLVAGLEVAVTGQARAGPDPGGAVPPGPVPRASDGA